MLKTQLIVFWFGRSRFWFVFVLIFWFGSLRMFSTRLWALLCTAICCCYHAYKGAKDDCSHFCIRQNGTAWL